MSLRLADPTLVEQQHPVPAAPPAAGGARAFPSLTLAAGVALLAMLSAIAAFGLYLSGDHSAFALRAARQEVAALARSTGALTAPLLEPAQRQALQATLLTLARHPRVGRIDLYDRSGQPIIGVARAADGTARIDTPRQSSARPDTAVAGVVEEGRDTGLWPRLPLQLVAWESFGAGTAAGWLRLSSPTESLRADTVHLLADTAWAGTLAGALAAAAALALLLPPLRALRHVTRFAAGLDERIGSQLPVTGRNQDVRDLTDALNRVSVRLAGQQAQVITSRARAETLLEQAQLSRDSAEAANRAKSAFVAKMSHQLRTPLNDIVGTAELALGTGLNTEQRGYVDTMRQSASALAGTIGNLLDFSTLEAGPLRLDAIECFPAEMLAEALKARAPEAHRKGLALACSVDGAVDARLIADPNRIGQVLGQLLDNAIRCTDDGEIEVTCHLASRLGRELELSFSVRDTGRGIDPSLQAGLFDAFAIAPVGSSLPDGGGLGLAICRRLVERMGGRIELHSSPGAGSLFRFSVLAEAIADTPLPPTRPPGLPDGARVLVVDDRPGCQRSLMAALRAGGLLPIAAADDTAALAIARAAAPLEGTRTEPGGEAGSNALTACVIGGSLKSGDAFELVARLRAAGLRELPFLMTLSTRELPRQQRRCNESGISAALLEPLAAADLLAALAQVVAARRPSGPAGGGAADASPKEPTGLHVLLAEDNSVNQMVARRILEKMGHQVSVVNNGLEAIEAVDSLLPDLVLMDIQMPVMGGIAATQAIRAKEASGLRPGNDRRNRRLPVVAMTAHAFLADRQSALAAGMDAYLTKPIDSARLREVLRQVAAPTAGGFGDLASTPFGLESTLGATPGDEPTPPSSGKPASDEPAGSPPLPSGPRFERHQLLEALGNDTELIERIAGLFKSTSAQALRKLIGALRSDDMIEAEFAAHSIKGTLAMLGATEVSQLAQRIESAAARREAAHARALLPAFEAAVIQVTQVLESVLAS